MTLTGRHVAAMFVGGFSIIIGVNIVLAVSAVRTFPGVEVKSPYVASQEFEARRAAQEALGWHAAARYEDGRFSLALTDAEGRPAPAQDLAVHIGRPTMERADAPVALDAAGQAALDLAPGLWRVDVTARAEDGTLFEQRLKLWVKK